MAKSYDDRLLNGDLAEARVVAELTERGIAVATPFGDNERYDLIAESPSGKLVRIQVKHGNVVDGTVRFGGASQHTNSQGSEYREYDEEIDFFIVRCSDLDTIYLVPEPTVGKRMSLRINPPEIQHPSINWAEEYEFDEQWPSSGETGNESSRLPPNRRGDATEAHVIAELLQRGIPLAVPPTDNERYDLLAGTPEARFLRIQVKTGWIQDGCITFQGTSTHTNAEGHVRKPYDGDADYFIVYVPPLDELYLIAEQAFDTNITLRVDEPKMVLRNTKWAEDYEFDRNWPPEESPDPTSSRHHPWDEVIRETVVEKLREIGDTVARPVHDDTPVDLLAETPDGEFLRLTIRTASCNEGRIFFHPDENDDENGIDGYLVYCHDLDRVYAIGTDAFDTSISLWVDEPKEVRRATTWAEDFELDQNWPPTRVYSRKSPIGRAITALRVLDAEIAHPTDDRPYDLLVGTPNDEFLRTAVEPGCISNGCIRLKPETKDGIDAFLVYCRELDTCYLIGSHDFDRSISLRVERPKQDHPSINRAEEYGLATRLPEFG